MIYIYSIENKSLFFCNCFIYTPIHRDLFTTIYVIMEEKRDPQGGSHRVSHVKSRVRERLIIYPFSDLFNRHSLKFIEGYLRNGKIK